MTILVQARPSELCISSWWRLVARPLRLRKTQRTMGKKLRLQQHDMVHMETVDHVEIESDDGSMQLKYLLTNY